MYLVIDRTKVNPFQGVVDPAGKCVGTMRMLDWRDLKDYAKWVGVNGGKDLLDKSEVQLINDGMLYVWPIDEDGEPLHDECEAVEIIHYDQGSRIVWTPKLRCETCCGEGHFNLYGEPVEEEDLCPHCDGDGYVWGAEFETDMNGNAVKEEA